MSAFTRKKHEFALTGIWKLSLVGFFTSFALALMVTVWSLYIDSFVHDIAKVGLISGLFAVVALIAHFAIIPIIERNEKSKLYLYSLFFFIFAYLLFAIIKNLWLFLALGVVMAVVATIRITCFGIIVKNKSKKSELTKNEGLVFTFLNLAFLLAPLVAGFIAASLSIRAVFILAATLFLMALIIFKGFAIKDRHISKTIDTNHIKNFIDFFRNKDRVIAYFVFGGVQMWWSLIYGFIPLYMIRNGLNEKFIGFFLFAVVVPLILLEYKLANKTGKTGFKKMFMTGYAIAATIAIICFFVQNIFVILALLTLASIGLAMIEPTIEAYFFHILKRGEENRFYSPFRTAIDVNFFISKILSALVLFILPFKYLFLLFGAFMVILFFISTKTIKIKNLKD